MLFQSGIRRKILSSCSKLALTIRSVAPTGPSRMRTLALVSSTRRLMSSPFRPMMLPTLSTGTTSLNTLSPGHPGHLFAATAASSAAAASASPAAGGGSDAGTPTSTAAADRSSMAVKVERARVWGVRSGCSGRKRQASERAGGPDKTEDCTRSTGCVDGIAN
jgi:hypothetical protein